MKIRSIKGGMLIERAGKSVVWCYSVDSCDISELSTKACICLGKKPKGMTDDVFEISGEGEWEFSEIMIRGFKCEKSCYYLVTIDNVTSLFVTKIQDIDDAFREIPENIDLFVIPLDKDNYNEEILKKRMDSIDTGIIVFTGKLAIGGEVLVSIKNTMHVPDIERKGTLSLDTKIDKGKKYYVMN